MTCGVFHDLAPRGIPRATIGLAASDSRLAAELEPRRGHTVEALNLPEAADVG